MNRNTIPRKFALSCTLASAIALSSASGQVTPGGTFGDHALILEDGGGEQLAAASASDGFGTSLLHEFDNALSVDGSYELNPNGNNSAEIALSAGRHLVMYDTRFDTTGGTNRAEVLANLNLAGTPLAIGRSQGFLRRLGGADEMVLSGGGIITVASDNDILTLETRRSDSNPSAGVLPTRAANGTAIQLLKLDDNWDFLCLQRSTNQAGTVDTDFTDVTYDTIDPGSSAGSAFSFPGASGDVTLNESGLYLVFANTRIEKADGNNVRTNYQQRLTLDGAEVEGSLTTTYLRGNANGENTQSGAAAIGTLVSATAGQVLSVELAMEAGGTPSTIQGNETALTIVKLPPGAKSISLTSAASQEVNTATTTPVTFDTSQFGNGLFSHTSGTSPVTVNDTDDYLFFGTIFTSSDATNDNQDRTVPLQGWQIDGAGGPIARGRAAAYNRDSTGDRTSGSWGGLITSLTAGQTIELTTERLGNTDTGATSSVSLKGLSISSLVVSNDPVVIANLPFEIVPGATEVITDAFLETFDNDTPASGITYTITSVPTGGTIMRFGLATLGLNDTFTQDDIDNSNIQFTADGSPIVGGFDFTVSDGSATDAGSFVINVKYPDTIVTIANAGDVAEGSPAVWTVTSTAAPTGSAMTVNISYSGTALDGSDFTGVASVDIPAGSTSANLNVPTLADGVFEGCETIVATIGTITGGELNPSAGANSSAILHLSDGGNSNPVLTGPNSTFMGTGTVPLAGLSVLDPDAGFQSAVSTSAAPLYSYNGATNVTTFGDFRPNDDSSFDYDAGSSGHVFENGFSLELDFAINPSDLSGSVQVWEIGGSSNGTTLLLIEGIPHLLVKSGGAAANAPTDDATVAGAFNDLDWAGDNTVVIPLATTALTPGSPSRIAVILSDAADTVTYSVNGAASASVSLLNNDANNWAGDHTINIGRNAGSGSGGNTNAAGSPFTDVTLGNLSGGPGAVACLKFWNDATGTLTTSGAVTPDIVTLTLTIDGWSAGAGSLTAGSGNGETYANGVWSITADSVTASAALAAVSFVSDVNTANPTIVMTSLEDGNEDGGGAATQGLIITSADPDLIYVDDDLAGTPFATAIADADSGAAVAPATVGYDAFATMAEALASVTATGTIIVNDGDYSGENVVLKDTITLQLTGNGTGTVTMTSLSSPTGPNIDLGAETLVINNTAQIEIDCPISGSGNLTKNGTGRFIVRGSQAYTGTLTVNDGFFRAGYESGEDIQSNFDGDGPIVINSPGAIEFNVGLNRTQTVTGVISGDGEVHKLEDGILVFDGPSANTFSGGFMLGDGLSTTFDGVDQGAQQGIVIVNHSGHLGTGPVLSRGAQLQAGSPGVVLANDINITNGGFRCGGLVDFELAGTITTIDGTTRGFGNYGLDGLDLIISGNIISTTGGNVSFEGSNDRDNGTWTVTGNISGPADVQVQTNFDDGEVTFTGTNTYLGTTLVGAGGVLYLNGSHTTGDAYTINDGGLLGGTGSTTSAVTVATGGTLSPGVDSIGTLSTGALTLNGNLAIDVDNTAGAAGTDWDQVAVAGSASVSGGALMVSQTATVEASPNDIVIISNDDADEVISPFLSGDPFTADYLSSGLAGVVDYTGGDGNDVALTTATTNAIAAWRVANFGSPDNSGNGENFSDAGDSDGLHNLLEFAFGTDPNTPDHADLVIDGSVNGIPIVNADYSGGTVEFNALFTRRDDHGAQGSVTYTPQFSSDLMTWADSEASPTLVADSTDDATYEVVSVPYPFFLPDGKKARYFRVAVTLVP
ncbi:cadherin-like domain-containing protein [Verrucomicrobiaceae bacterium 227]